MRVSSGEGKLAGQAVPKLHVTSTHPCITGTLALRGLMILKKLKGQSTQTVGEILAKINFSAFENLVLKMLI